MNYSPARFAGFTLWKKRPIHLTFFVTRRCNARCPFCFYLRSEGSPITEADAGTELTLGEIERVAGSLGRLLWVAFSGGEVFLREDLAEISEVFYRLNKPPFILFSTNGLLPGRIREVTEEILKRCPRSVVTVKLSLDGLGEEHDRLRGVPGAYERVLETHRLLADLPDAYPNFELGINSVFCAGNQGRMEPLLEHVRGLRGVRTHTVSMVRGNLREAGMKEVDLGRYTHVSRLMEAALQHGAARRYRFAGGGLKAAQDILQRRLILQTLTEGRRVIPCYAGRLNLVLTESGEVYPCELRSGSMGHVKDHDYDMGRLLRTPQARQVLRDIALEECHCTHECYFITNILFNPRTYPALLREYRKLARSRRGVEARPAPSGS